MLTEPEQSAGDTHHHHQPPSLGDYVREGWKDLGLDFRIYKDDVQRGYGTTTGAVKQVYGSTKGAAKGAFRTVKEDLGEQFQELKADFTVQKTMVKQDFREFWQAGRDWASQVTARRQQQQQQQAEEESQSESSTTSSHHGGNSHHNQQQNEEQAILHPTTLQQSKIQEIREFEATLADPAFISELNELIQSKLTSCPDLVTYYQERPELKEFTLTKELPRMKYTLFTAQGQKLTEPKDIAEYARTAPTDERHDIIWRAANQSIFGDVISTLTCDAGLIRPHFQTASFVDDVSVTLDLGRDTPHITAECFVNVTIPGYEGERLQLAGALVGVYFCPATSKMEARVLHISPTSVLTNEQLEGAADNLTSR
jgi:hypothetical protein